MPDVAAFDFDGTLAEGGSVFGYLSALRGSVVVASAALVFAPRLVHAALAAGTVADRTKELLFERVLAGVDLDRAEEVGAAFARSHLDHHLRPSVRPRFDWHRRRGDRVVIVSASPDLYVGPAGERLGADGVVATRLAVSDQGRLTGRYEGANCRGTKSSACSDGGSMTRGGRPTASGPTATAGATSPCSGRPTSGSTWESSARSAGCGRSRASPAPDPASTRAEAPGAGLPRPSSRTPEASGADLRGQRYSFFLIHTRTNQPQMGGR